MRRFVPAAGHAQQQAGPPDKQKTRPADLQKPGPAKELRPLGLPQEVARGRRRLHHYGRGEERFQGPHHQ